MYDFIGGPTNSLMNLKSLSQPVFIICIVSHVLYFNFNKISTSTLENKKKLCNCNNRKYAKQQASIPLFPDCK